MFKKLYIMTVIAAACMLFTGCGAFSVKEKQASDTGIYFDTAVSVTIYGERADELLKGCFELCDEMEDILSAQNEDSELFRVNHRGSEEVPVSEELAECIAMGLEAGEISEGEFDITILPVSELWDFRTGKNEVPDPAKIQTALKKVDRNAVLLESGKLTFSSEDTMIDLGAVAKGYISGRLKDYLKSEGCEGAVINLGGNVSTLGRKSSGPFRIGIQKPFSDRGEVLLTVSTGEGCVISSGIYERCFEENGTLYHHILSASTGYPSDTGLAQVSVIGEDDMLCDTLSTVFMLTGKERAEELIMEKGYDVKAVFTGRDGSIIFFDPDKGESRLNEGDVLDVEQQRGQ